VAARSFAIRMNHFIDRKIDLDNPRTKDREIPSGRLSPLASLSWSLAAGGIFVGAAFALNPLSGYCSLPLLFILAFYSFWKRFSWLTHWYLGACLGFAPIAVCIALSGGVSFAVICLGLAVTMWTAGFDVLYSLQDIDFDRERSLKSAVAEFGPAKAIRISRLSFVAMVVLLMLAGMFSGMGLVYFGGVLVIACILAYEHFLIRDAKVDGHSKNLGKAFFTVNAYISVAYFILSLSDAWLAGL